MDIEIGEAKFNQAKKYAEDFYQTIGAVYCPYLKDKVVFNAKGIEHLKFKKRNKARTRVDQYVRLRVLSIAPKIISESHTLQGILETKGFEYEKISSRWEWHMRDVVYLEFVAVYNKTRVRVIVKQVGNGPRYFWSVIPFWRVSKNSGKRILHNEKPEED